MYVLGIDEAGLGPNLGPLVVAASVWKISNGQVDCDLYECLAPAVTSTLDPKQAVASAPIVIADSKQLYKPAGGLRLLEQGLLAMLGTIERCPTTWRTAWGCLAHEDCLNHEPWHTGYDLPLPIACLPELVQKQAEALLTAFRQAGVELVDLKCRAVFPGEFNQYIERLNNKSSLLTQVSIELLGDKLASLPEAPVAVYCDKHGGRNFYAAPVQHVAGEEPIRIVSESATESCYRFQRCGHTVEVRFCEKGERHLPVALASMAAKYLRELAMRSFNDFWKQHVPELRPTAGYPQDARRFRDNIRPVQRKLGISDRLLWRCR